MDDYLERTQQYLFKHAATQAQLQLFKFACENFLKKAELNISDLNCIVLPKMIYQSNHRDIQKSPSLNQLLIITMLIDIWIVLIDDYMDQEIQSAGLQSKPAFQIQLICYDFLSVIQLAITELLVCDSIKIKILQIFSKICLEITAGQFQEFYNMQHTDTLTQSDIFKSIRGKTAKWRELYVKLAMILATGSLEGSELYLEFSDACSMAGQLSNDVHDLFIKSYSFDLKNGVKTFPIVAYSELLSSDKKQLFLNLLDRAKIDDAIHSEIKSILITAGCLQYSIMMIDLSINQSLNSLKKINLQSNIKKTLIKKIKNKQFILAKYV